MKKTKITNGDTRIGRNRLFRIHGKKFQRFSKSNRRRALENGADAAVGFLGEVGKAALGKSAERFMGMGMGAFAGPAGAMVGGVLAELFIPDPNNIRIENLESGMLCLSQEVLELEKEMDDGEG